MSCERTLSVPFVATGTKQGVSTSPCGVRMRPTRARDRVDAASTSKANEPSATRGAAAFSGHCSRDEPFFTAARRALGRGALGIQTADAMQSKERGKAWSGDEPNGVKPRRGSPARQSSLSASPMVEPRLLLCLLLCLLATGSTSAVLEAKALAAPTQCSAETEPTRPCMDELASTLLSKLKTKKLNIITAESLTVFLPLPLTPSPVPLTNLPPPPLLLRPA